MAKKKTTEETSQIEEIDLSSIDVDSLFLPEIDGLDNKEIVSEKPIEKKKPVKTEKKKSTIEDKKEKNTKKSSNEDEDDFLVPKKTEDEDDFFAEFNDDFDIDDIDDEELLKIEKEGGFDKMPKDFFTDKRRQKNLKKFLDVEVPAEFLEGLDENMQLLFKK